MSNINKYLYSPSDSNSDYKCSHHERYEGSGGDGKGATLGEYCSLGVPEEETVGGDQGQGRDQLLLARDGPRPCLGWGDCCTGLVTHG